MKSHRQRSVTAEASRTVPRALHARNTGSWEHRVHRECRRFHHAFLLSYAPAAPRPRLPHRPHPSAPCACPPACSRPRSSPLRSCRALLSPHIQKATAMANTSDLFDGIFDNTQTHCREIWQDGRRTRFVRRACCGYSESVWREVHAAWGHYPDLPTNASRVTA